MSSCEAFCKAKDTPGMVWCNLGMKTPFREWKGRKYFLLTVWIKQWEGLEIEQLLPYLLEGGKKSPVTTIRISSDL